MQAALEDWLERSYRYKKVISDRIDPPKKKRTSKKSAAETAQEQGEKEAE